MSIHDEYIVNSHLILFYVYHADVQ